MPQKKVWKCHNESSNSRKKSRFVKVLKVNSKGSDWIFQVWQASRKYRFKRFHWTCQLSGKHLFTSQFQEKFSFFSIIYKKMWFEPVNLNSLWGPCGMWEPARHTNVSLLLKGRGIVKNLDPWVHSAYFLNFQVDLQAPTLTSPLL